MLNVSNVEQLIKPGISSKGKQRYYCKNDECTVKSFQIGHSYEGCNHGIYRKIIEMDSY